jgi:hypothetical protein
MKNPLYWSKLDFLSQIFATIRQLKKKHWAGGIPKISGPRGQRPRELVTLVGMHPPDPMMALPDVNKKTTTVIFQIFMLTLSGYQMGITLKPNLMLLVPAEYHSKKKCKTILNTNAEELLHLVNMASQ